MTKDIPLVMRFVLCVAMTSMYGYALFNGVAEAGLRDALVALTTASWMWFFGSSKGSSDKTEMIKNGRQ